jgi:ABC-2 type transport system ATP-binding protein
MTPQPLVVDEVSKSFRKGGLFVLARNGRQAPARVSNAVDRVSLTIDHGEIYGVIGANGSGKSTLIRMISTLLLPDAGSIRVFGHDVVDEPMEVQALINRVSADPSFFRVMSAMENLGFFARAYGLDRDTIRERVPRVLERLGVDPDLARQPMRNLSRGQQQKIAVARSFLTAPNLMLLDEPTTGLDPRSKRDVQSFVRDVRDTHGTSILLTTHDMDEADLLCDRIAFLAGGRVVAEGTPDELRALVARGRRPEQIDLEDVFLEITGRPIEEDEEEVVISG